MAIDDAEKRRAISGIVIPLIPGVTPNVSKDAEWRQQSGWSYSGIALAAPVARFLGGKEPFVLDYIAPSAIEVRFIPIEDPTMFRKL